MADCADYHNSAGPKATIKLKDGFGLGISALAGFDVGATFDLFR
jgi:hypothetical protein